MVKIGISRRNISLPDATWAALDALVAEHDVPGFVVLRAAMLQGVIELRGHPDLIVTSEAPLRK